MFITDEIKIAKHNLLVAKIRMESCAATITSAKALIELVGWQMSQGPTILQEQQALVKAELEGFPTLEKIFFEQQDQLEKLKAILAAQTRPAGGTKSHNSTKRENARELI